MALAVAMFVSLLRYSVDGAVYPAQLLNRAALEAWIVMSIDDAAPMPQVITSLGSVAGGVAISLDTFEGKPSLSASAVGNVAHLEYNGLSGLTLIRVCWKWGDKLTVQASGATAMVSLATVPNFTTASADEEKGFVVGRSPEA